MTDPHDPLPPDPQADRFVAGLFASMDAPPVPAAMRDASFLESIYERAAIDAEEALAPVLDAGLQGVSAPEDTTWLEISAEQETWASRVTASAPPETHPAPALLWTRIRADLHQHLAEEKTRSRFLTRRWVAGLAAAVLLSATLYGYLQSRPSFSSDGGTLDKSRIVFRLSQDLRFDDRLIGG